EVFESELDNRRTSPRGRVHYAMPESCQWTTHYRTIMSQLRELPEIQFTIDILPSDQIIAGTIAGQFDFGFVVGERISPELRFHHFADEAYSAVAADKSLLRAFDAKDGSPRWVTFPGWDIYLLPWAKAHGLWKQMKSRAAQATVHVGTLAGAIHAIQA